MTDTYTMKSVFSCSDFLSDIWQGGPEAVETLDSLANCPSEGGSTHLGRGRSADLFNLLGQTEEADSHSRIMQSLAASSSNKDSSGGQFLAGEPVESNLPNNNVSEHPMMSTEPFLPKQASTFSQYSQHPTQLQPLAASSNEHGNLHMDPIKQAKAICNHGVNATVLQQQLAEMKSRASGIESFANYGSQSGASASCHIGSAKHHTAASQGTPEPLAPKIPLPGPTPTTASVPQPQLSLQESQLWQLASLLGSANMAALQSMTLPAAVPSTPANTGRGLAEQPSSSTKSHEHSSGDDDTGAIPELHKLTSAGDSLGDEEEHEHAWEAKLDKNLAPPEMKRMRRMLSNRESARRSRRRKQAHMQDLEVQNNELVGTNQKLQKELSALRTLAKEAIMDKKRSQTALETLKQRVVHLLGERDMLPTQELAKKREGERQEPPTPASTGTDSDVSGSGRLEMKVAVSAAGGLQGCPSSPAPEGKLDPRKHAPAEKHAKSAKAAVSPKFGVKRKALELDVSPESGVKQKCVEL